VARCGDGPMIRRVEIRGRKLRWIDDFKCLSFRGFYEFVVDEESCADGCQFK